MLDEDADLGWLDYGFRNYDPQIGRFPQLDPLTFSYPFLTPYQYASCDPIMNIDIDGLEGKSSLGKLLETAGKAFTEAAEHGGAVKELTGIFLTASYSVSRATKQLRLVLSAGNIIKMANVAVSIINSSPTAKQIGNKGPIVMNNQRYNHHTGQYLPNQSGSSNKKRNGSTGSNRGGIVLTSEFGGGNNAPPGQTDEDPIKADLLLLMASSWMGEDIEFAKKWNEIVEKFPNKLKEANELMETYNELKQRMIIEIYLKKKFKGGTVSPIKFDGKGNFKENKNTGIL